MGEAQKTSISVAERLLAKILAGGLVGSANEFRKLLSSQLHPNKLLEMGLEVRKKPWS